MGTDRPRTIPHGGLDPGDAALRERLAVESLPFGAAVAYGFSWLLTQSLVLKVVSVTGRVVLARLMTPREFGLMGLADTVALLALLVQRNGLREMLVRQGERQPGWLNAGFWFSMASALVASALMLLGVPAAVRFYGDALLRDLLLFLAFTLPLMSLGLVPLARLEAQMRYRPIAVINMISGSSATVIAVICAVAGLGAMSLAVPRAVVAAGSALALWFLAGPRLRPTPDLVRWPHLLEGGALLFLVSLAGLVISHGDYAIVGRVLGTEAAGLYVFAFGLAEQAGLLVTANLSMVLLPALSRLQGAPCARQRQALLDAMRTCALAATPLALLQAALAGPLVRVVFGARWEPAVPLVQALSLGLSLAVLAGPAQAFVRAQGRWRWLLGYSSASAAGFLIAAIAASTTGRLVAIAAAVALYYAADGVGCATLVLRLVEGRPRELASVLAPVVAAAALGVGLGFAVCVFLPFGWGGDVARLLVMPPLSGAAYLWLLRCFSPSSFEALPRQVRRLVVGGRG